MTKSAFISAPQSSIQLAIQDHGAFPVLWAALAALFTRKPRSASPIRPDVTRLNDWMRADIGLPPRELQSSFPHRSP